MTEQGQQSAFNSRSDNAALKLKGEIGARTGVDLPSRQVAVGPDGKPPAPPPPPGSYARQAHDQQMLELQRQQQQALAGQPAPQQILGDQPPAGTPDQQADGSQAPPLAPGQPLPAGPESPPHPPQHSDAANNRIQGLISELRDRDRRIAELAGGQADMAKLQEQVSALVSERDNLMQEGLAELDPEQRALVLAEGRMQEIVAQGKTDLLAQLQPQLSTLRQQNQQTEVERVAQKYPAFDLAVHGNLVDMVRGKFPGMTYEMAWKTVAEGDEAVTRDRTSVVAVPPVVPAGNGSPLPRYMPEPEANPDDELRAFQQRTNELIRSSSPAEQRQGLRQMDEAISQRLGGANYQGRPRVFD